MIENDELFNMLSTHQQVNDEIEIEKPLPKKRIKLKAIVVFGTTILVAVSAYQALRKKTRLYISNNGDIKTSSFNPNDYSFDIDDSSLFIFEEESLYQDSKSEKDSSSEIEKPKVCQNQSFLDVISKLGTADEYTLNYIENNEYKDLFIKYGEMYGIDYNLFTALCCQESALCHFDTIPGGKNYNGFAVGITQQETPGYTDADSEFITAYNYITNEYDNIYCNLENTVDLEKNIQIGYMRFQGILNKYNGNIFLAIQEYNYGQTMMKNILEQMSADKKISVDDIINNHTNLDWLTYVKEAYTNPQKYIPSWNYKTYGDPNYVTNVLKNIDVKYYNLVLNCKDKCYEYNLLDGTYISSDIEFIQGKGY